MKIDKDNVQDVIGYIALMVGLYACVWGMGTFFADKISDYEVINPKDGVECVVVSRMFNTSVDCWKDDE